MYWDADPGYRTGPPTTAVGRNIVDRDSLEMEYRFARHSLRWSFSKTRSIRFTVSPTSIFAG